MKDHLERYLKDGKDGHLFDTLHLGGRVDTTTLVIKTIGRKSGNPLLTPLIYVKYGEEYAIAASKGGADEHPAWYLNLTSRPELRFKVVDDIFEGTWRQVEGAERAEVYQALSAHYPPYVDYANKAKREIPVILLKPARKVDAL